MKRRRDNNCRANTSLVFVMWLLLLLVLVSSSTAYDHHHHHRHRSTTVSSNRKARKLPPRFHAASTSHHHQQHHFYDEEDKRRIPTGKLIGYVEIIKKGDVFHDLFRHNPHNIAAISPDKVHDCELHDGERGAVGSVICWRYTHEGKKKLSKQIIEAVNEENHTAVFKVIGGDLVEELYKRFTVIMHVEEKGDGQVVVWTLEFEKPDTSVPYPTSLMDFLCNLIKDLDAHTTTN